MRFGRAMWLSLFPCLHLCRWKGILGHDFGGRKLIGNGLNVTSRWCLLKESRAVSDDVLTRDSVGINSFVELPMLYGRPCLDVTGPAPLRLSCPLSASVISPTQNTCSQTIRKSGPDTNLAHFRAIILAHPSEPITPWFLHSLAGQLLDGIAIGDARIIARDDKTDVALVVVIYPLSGNVGR